jgi:hypothetical protein
VTQRPGCFFRHLQNPMGRVFLLVLVSYVAVSFLWFNPATGAAVTGKPIPSGTSSQVFTPPFSGDAVLYLVDTKGHATSSSL